MSKGFSRETFNDKVLSDPDFALGFVEMMWQDNGDMMRENTELRAEIERLRAGIAEAWALWDGDGDQFGLDTCIDPYYRENWGDFDVVLRRLVGEDTANE